jgi:serine/threonine protein kinase
MENLTGKTIDRFQIVALLGQGGMATVYKAHDSRLDRDVAIKLIRRSAFPPEMLDRILVRFEREARSMARLAHPNIVKVHDYGEYEGSPYLVLEYLPGGDLKGRLDGKPIAWQEAVRFILPVARALQFSHKQGIIHRDIKPSNILFTASDEPMLSDFGIAKILEYEDAYWIDQTEVTNGMYALCVSAGKCNPPRENSSYSRSSYYGDSKYDNYPVIKVDWDQAKTYCAWVGAELPTEAQWEKAARGEGGRVYPWGNNSPTCDLTNYGYCIRNTTAVKSYESGKSLYGAYDMAGNVWEWVNDWYGGTYYETSPSSNPTGPSSGTYRILRGGASLSVGHGIRSAVRYRVGPVYRSGLIGFRCARPAP